MSKLSTVHIKTVTISKGNNFYLKKVFLSDIILVDFDLIDYLVPNMLNTSSLLIHDVAAVNAVSG